MTKNLSNQIKQLREKQGLSQSQLADRAELSLAYIMKMEKGINKSPSLKTAQKLSIGLGITLREFLESLGHLQESKSRPSSELIAQSLRTDGYSKEQIDEILKYAEYLKAKSNNS